MFHISEKRMKNTKAKSEREKRKDEKNEYNRTSFELTSDWLN